MTLRQQVHNLIYGENSRRVSRIYHHEDIPPEMRYTVFADVFMTPDVNRVWGPDLSPWDGNVGLAITKDLGASFVFIKGLDGTVQCKYYVDNRARAMNAGLLQAPYQWLYRNMNVSCVAQAQALDSLLKKYPSDLPAVIDFEWTRWAGAASNPIYSDLDLWVTEFLRLGNRKPILYTAPAYISALGKMPDALRAKFSALWIANYGVSNPIVPTGFPSWDFWQFTDSADASIYTPNDVSTKEVDVSYWHGDKQSLYAFAGIGEPTPDITHTQPYTGVDHYQFKKNGVDVFVKLINMNGKRAKVVYDPWLKTVSEFAKENGAQMAFNGNAWDFRSPGPWKPQGLAVSNGHVIANDLSSVPYLNISQDNHLVMPFMISDGLYTAVSGFRYLVRDGKNIIPADGTEDKYTELHARSAKGISADGCLMTVIANGTPDMKTGLTLHMLAEIFVQFGALVAMDNDSGGSSTDYTEAMGGVLNTPSDGHERAVSTALLIFTDEGAPTMSDYYEIVGTDGNNHTVRTHPDVRASSILRTITNTIKAKSGATTDDVYIYATDVLDSHMSTGYAARRGDKWRKVYEVDGEAAVGWTAEIHLGVRQGISVTLIPATVLPPAEDKPKKITIEMESGKVFVADQFTQQ